MIYKDLRGFIKQVDELGVLRRVHGADPKFELGGITEVAAGTPECPALLFDRIKGYEPGVRVFTNATTTPQRAAPLSAVLSSEESRSPVARASTSGCVRCR